MTLETDLILDRRRLKRHLMFWRSFAILAVLAAVLVSTTKLRQAGFGDCVDTEVMFKTWLGRLAERGVIPTP